MNPSQDAWIPGRLARFFEAHDRTDQFYLYGNEVRIRRQTHGRAEKLPYIPSWTLAPSVEALKKKQ